MSSKPSILFINPSSAAVGLPIPPLGVLYLSAFLRENGYDDLFVVDNNLEGYDEANLEKVILNSDIVCVTGTTAQFSESVTIASLAKKHGKVSIVGGPHATGAPEDMITRAGFDYVVIGEGERALLDLINAITNKTPIDDVQGIVFERNGGVLTTPGRKFIRDIDELPFPARDLVDMRRYGNKEVKRFEGKYTHMMTSRGCGHHCTFCGSPVIWKYCRLTSAPIVFEEMMEVYNKYGISNIHFQDDNFTIHKARAMELCQLMLDSGIDWKWSCQTRPTGVDKELLDRMKASGCVQVEFGVESGDEDMLIRIKKKYTKKQIKNAFDIAREAGLETHGFFIVGLPQETVLSWLKTIWFARQLKLSVSMWTVLLPFPGTEIYNKNQVHIIDKDYANWTYKHPVIRHGWRGPWVLKAMRWIADACVNGLFNTGTYKKTTE